MSATIEEAAPTAAMTTAGAAETAPVEAASSGAPKDTGTFPNLNIKPQVATEQITPEEKAAHVEALTAAQQQHAATSATAGKGTTNPVLLRKLAATHATDALKEIEGKQ